MITFLSLFLAQANEWLKNIEKSNGLRVIQCTDDSYVDALADAISMGVSVLLENMRKKKNLINTFAFSLNEFFVPNVISL